VNVQFVSMAAGLLALLMLASLSPAGQVAASQTLPLKGTIESVESFVVDFPTMPVTGSGSGNATHLGRYTVTYQFVVDLVTLEGGPATATYVAANGDELYAEGNGQGAPTGDPEIFAITEWWTITGGTGRFEGASGSYVTTRMVSLASGESSGSFDGTIVLNHGQ
jgi:hypothetical protein